ncbi:MAG: hypothetical protein HPY75_03300 [Actinobacteria bacterium]|nr:hypothetical protein [Actinomycetota bacterium]
MVATKGASPDVRCYLTKARSSNIACLTILDVRAGMAVTIRGIAPWLPSCSSHIRKPPEPPIRPSGRLGHRISLSEAPRVFLRELDRLDKAGELTPGMEEALTSAKLVLIFSGKGL